MIIIISIYVLVFGLILVYFTYLGFVIWYSRWRRVYGCIMMRSCCYTRGHHQFNIFKRATLFPIWTGNMEKFILYIVVGIAVGVICVLLVIICRINQLRRRQNHEAKLNISEPIANSNAAQQAETTSLLDASDPSDGGVEMTGYNQIGSLHRPPISSFTDPYEEETPVSFATRDHRQGSFGRMAPNNPDPTAPPMNTHQASYTGPVSKKPQNGGNGATFGGSLSRPNHTRHTSFSGSTGRGSQPGMLTGSLNRRDHWTNEYRNEGHHHTLQHYYG